MRIGIISSHLAGLSFQHELGYEAEALQKELSQRGHSVTLIDPLKTTFGTSGSECFARFSDREGVLRSVLELDVLLVRRTSGHIDEIIDFCKFAMKANQNLTVLDPIESMGRPTSKVEAIAHRAGFVSQPTTQIVRTLSHLDKVFKYPVVSKPMFGTAGDGVVLCQNEKELEEQLKASYGERSGYAAIVQSDVTGDYEFRVVVVNGIAVDCAYKPESETTFARNSRNVSGFKLYDGVNKHKVMKFAEDVSLYMGHFLSGVDIIQSGDEFFVLECNRNPQFKDFDAAIRASNDKARTTSYFIAKGIEQKTGLEPGVYPRKKKVVSNDARYRPTVFIGSSSEGLKVAESVQWGLNRSGSLESTVWTQDVFRPASQTYSDLLSATKRFDYAIFCITADDELKYREQDLLSPRDNVIFEAGLFIGAIGPEKVFFLVSSEQRTKLPTDINGVNLTFWHPQADGSLRSALGAALFEIKEAIGV